MDIRYFIEAETDEPHIYDHGVTEEEVEFVLRHPGEDRPGSDDSRHALGQTTSSLSASNPPKETMMTGQRFPAGWDKDRVLRLIVHYDSLTEEEQLAEDEAAVGEQPGQTVIAVPDGLLPAIRQLLAGAENS